MTTCDTWPPSYHHHLLYIYIPNYILCVCVCVLNTCIGPGWLKNLYFTYLVVLKAVVKGEQVWRRQDVFHTLDNTEDTQTREDISTLVEAVKWVAAGTNQWFEPLSWTVVYCCWLRPQEVWSGFIWRVSIIQRRRLQTIKGTCPLLIVTATMCLCLL